MEPRLSGDVPGLEVTSRPDFPFPDYRLGACCKAQVHMGAEVVPGQAAIHLGTRAGSARDQNATLRPCNRRISAANPVCDSSGASSAPKSAISHSRRQ